MGERRSAAAFGNFGASGCFLWVDPAARLACAAVTDRVFADGGWGMATGRPGLTACPLADQRARRARTMRPSWSP
jgi:CubicO group peptidase (beta-lactamase class C family)